MQHIIRFHIQKGETQYVATGVELPIVTQGHTLDDLMNNIREAVELQLEDENPAEFNLVKQPSVLVDFELPVYA